jgi:solute carrier family 45 protein 1/2/4
MQIPWPAAKSRHRSHQEGSLPQDESVVPPEDVSKVLAPTVDVTKQRLSTWNLITLSISMAGAQIAWTVELGYDRHRCCVMNDINSGFFSYGTPFLLDLGLSEQLTSLVWLAGPISGLIAQPLIGTTQHFAKHTIKLITISLGAISDSSASKYRRRYWIATSTVVLVLATLSLAYCQSIAAFFVDFFGGGAGDWDPQRIKLVSSLNLLVGLLYSETNPGSQYRHLHRRCRILSPRFRPQCLAGVSAEPSFRYHPSGSTQCW